MNSISTKKLLGIINRSKSYEESFNECYELVKRAGFSESFLNSVHDLNKCSYDEGMFISKAFDIYNTVPKMKWLPDQIKSLYNN